MADESVNAMKSSIDVTTIGQCKKESKNNTTSRNSKSENTADCVEISDSDNAEHIPDFDNESKTSDSVDKIPELDNVQTLLKDTAAASQPVDAWITEQDDNAKGDCAAISQINQIGEEQQQQQAQQQANQPASKVSGYLGKKGKLRMVYPWKKYWFVLEGRLLLYYRSKAEYDSLSPCKGSITLGAPCNIKPGSTSNYVFQLETRNNTITLRAETRAEQDKWMLAILGALKQTQSSKMSHFRYSADDLAVRSRTDKQVEKILKRQFTLPDYTKTKNAFGKEKLTKTMVERLEAIGAQSYVHNKAEITGQTNSNRGSPKLPKNSNLKKLLEKQISVTSSQQSEDDWIQDSDVERNVENELYSTFQPSKDRHIYQEIVPAEAHDPPEAIVENASYADIDHNKNHVEYWEPIYGETVVPSLPPRPCAVLAETDDSKLQNLAKLVREDRKDGTKRKSFVIRMLNKMKRNETASDTKPKECKKPKDAVIEELNEAIQANHVDVEQSPNIEAIREDHQEKTDKTELPSSKLEQLPQFEQPQFQDISNKNDEHTQSDQNDNDHNQETEEVPAAEFGEDVQETEKLTSQDFAYELYDPSQRLNIPRPKLICRPKGQKRVKAAPEMQQSNKTRISPQNCEQVHEPPLTAPLNDNLRFITIDEILDDLECHDYEPFSRQRVKELIEKFNDAEGADQDEEQIQTHLLRQPIEQPEELNSLLDELSKVANAPVFLTDTNIVCNSGLPREEWKKVVPIRKRTLSDPDYDIPRPHSALQIIPNKGKEDTKMQPTRFFGPVIIDQINGDTSCGTSITPDSLEVDVLGDSMKNYTPSIEEDRSMQSYTSHIYASNESHLNNNVSNQNSHVHYKPGTLTGKSFADQRNENAHVKTKADYEQTLCLSDKNNNNTHLEDVKSRNCHCIENFSATCYDSLEPFIENSQ